MGGRGGFKTSMLYYDTNNCNFCGKICINHDDNFLEDLICLENNKQFYCTQKSTHISYYMLHYGGKSSWKFLNLTQKKADASICNSCYKDESDYNSKYVIYLHSIF